MGTHPKLTKKQKKAAAFRERKAGKGKNKGQDNINDIPILEDQDMVDADGSQTEVEAVVVEEKKRTSIEVGKSEKNADKGKGKAEEGRVEQIAGRGKKRKHDVDMEAAVEVGGQDDGMQTAKRKKSTHDAKGSGTSTEKVKEKAALHAKQRYILFVGNLKYTTSLATIQGHFAACDPPPTVRLLTPKQSTSTRPVNKSKGCAFLEFSHRNALQQALKLHQSELEGRMINVELTAGGGGKSNNRITKVRERNKELFGQRKERIEKQGLDGLDRPQRYSGTSGIDQVSVARRTWTVGDIGDELVHRGGKRHSKDSKRKRPNGKVWGTGVNAIPVG